jgi:hypothetical protein
VAAVEDELADARIPSPTRWHRTTVVVMARPEVAAHFRDLLARVRRHLDGHADDGACVRFMLSRFAAEHAHDGVLDIVKKYPVFERDQWPCSNLSCFARAHFEDHHLDDRSGGGSDEPWNRACTCWWCHHVVNHGGHATLTGTAPHDLTLLVDHGSGRVAYRNGLRADPPREVSDPVEAH